MNELLAISNDSAGSPAIVRVVAWTLLHFFWQGALIAAALAGLLTALRRRSSGLRYGVAIAALALMAVMPVATGWWLASGQAAQGVGDDLSAPAAASLDSAARVSPKASPTSAATAPAPADNRLVNLPSARWLDPTLPWLVILWLVGVVGLSSVQLGGWMRVRRLRTRGVQPAQPRWNHACQSLARRLGIRRPVELLESTRVAVPAAVGWLKPVILFPASTFTGLAPRQIESILAHELAHVRRHDYLVNVLQVALETLLFYHPAVWWTSRQVRDLREHCCDDLAVAMCGDRMVYARALADLEELRFATPVFALGADGGSLLERIRRLAGKEAAGAADRSPGWIAGALGLTAVTASAAVLAFVGQPGLAQEPADLSAPDISIRSVPLVPPVILAQVVEEPEEMVMTRQSAVSDVTPLAETVAPEAPSKPSGSLPIPIDDLIEMKIHGLDSLIDEVQGTAYAGLPTRQLLDMARYGVDRELITELEAAGYRNLSAAELVELSKFGVDGELIGELDRAGFEALQAAELVELSKFGVDGELIAELEAAGLRALEVAELVELSKFGVDGELISELGHAGFKGLSIAELVELSKFGVDGDYIQEMRSAGYASTSIAELVELSKFGVDDELIGELERAGFSGLSAGELVELSKFGVDGELIRELAEYGYENLSADDLVELSKFGVDGDYIRELRDAGAVNLSVEDLSRLARHGIDAEFLGKMRQREQI